MGSYHLSNLRTDEQLDAMLHEAGHWTVNGRDGQVLCSAASLRSALDRVAEYSASGVAVTAICRQPGNNIIVFAEQMERLRQIIAGRNAAHQVEAT